MKQQRDFKGIWIPKEIWLDERLTYLDKVILMEIDSLDNDEEGCYASNEYLAEFCDCSCSKVSKAIKKLEELGFIKTDGFDGRKRHLKSNLIFGLASEKMIGRVVKNDRQSGKKYQADYQKVSGSIIYNNIDNNINNNIEENKNKSKRFVPPTIDEVNEYIKSKELNVDAKSFVEYFEANDWKDSKGNKVKSWKQKLLTWNNFNNKKQVKTKQELNDEVLERFIRDE